jgi:hypothetical protein
MKTDYVGQRLWSTGLVVHRKRFLGECDASSNDVFDGKSNRNTGDRHPGGDGDAASNFWHQLVSTGESSQSLAGGLVAVRMGRGSDANRV